MSLTTQTTAADSANPKVASATIEGDLPEVNDRYADSIILDGCEHLYDAFEIQGVRDLLAGTASSDTRFEVDNINPQLFSVYGHHLEDGADAVGDFSTYQLAADYARELSEKYGLQVFDFVADIHKGRKTLQ